MFYEFIKGGGYPIQQCIPPSMHHIPLHQNLAVPLDLVIVIPYQSHINPISHHQNQFQKEETPNDLLESENIQNYKHNYESLPILEDELFHELLEQTQFHSQKQRKNPPMIKTKEKPNSNAPKSEKGKKKRTIRKQSKTKT
jgi:hypothetical protein